VFGRLAAIKQMNVVPGERGAEQAIDLSDCYTTPQILYFQFPTTIAAGSAAAVARLATYFLLVAGTSVPKRRQVYVVIDEFQRMASDNLDALFQMARSHDISLIIAN